MCIKVHIHVFNKRHSFADIYVIFYFLVIFNILNSTCHTQPNVVYMCKLFNSFYLELVLCLSYI